MLILFRYSENIQSKISNLLLYKGFKSPHKYDFFKSSNILNIFNENE